MKKRAKTHPGCPCTEPGAYSVYVGRERLGHYVHLDKKQFAAFDREDRPLGIFRKAKEALNAIDLASDERP
jgi:hypothetical protein